MKLKIDIKKLSELLEIFYDVAKVRTVIFDDEFNKITAYPDENCPFCDLLKKNPESRNLCRKNDQKACAECKASNKLYIYKCHAGLFEAVAPIKMNDIILGYIMLGQVLEKGAERDKISDYASKYIFDSAELEKSVKKLKQKSIHQLESLARLMEISTCYLEITNLISIDEENLILHLSNYISNNLRNDLSVENILEHFDISRSRLYEVSHKYFGMSIAKYIRHKRIMLSAEILEKKELPISEAAAAAGFTDYNYFSKVFKKELGMTPSMYKSKLYNSDQSSEIKTI